MIEAPNNLACLQHGADPQYIKLHTQTQKELRYDLKHKYRVSTTYNKHSTNQPWHGMGQGTGDTSNCWVIGTDSMSEAYSQKANGWTLPSPLKHPTQKQICLKLSSMMSTYSSDNPKQSVNQHSYPWPKKTSTAGMEFYEPQGAN